MNQTDLVMPKLGLTMTEGRLSEWHVRPGDRVSKGDVLFIVETEKIANEIEAPTDGTVGEVLVPAGDTVPVGTPLARWSGAALANGAEAAAAESNSANGVDKGRLKSTPLARRIARDRGIDLASVKGTGPGGRIKAGDLRDLEGEPTPPAAKPARDPVSAPGGRRIEPGPKHAAMARRVAASKREIPHFYVQREAEVSELTELRKRLNAGGGPKISVNHFILKAVGRALVALPEANRIWSDDAFLQFETTDVGMVVNTDDGLFVPILRNVAGLPLDALAETAAAAAERARTGALKAEDMEGGAISVSNLGMFDATATTPIINAPQSAMLGVGAVRELFRPDTDGSPALRRELTLVLACDHRVFHGVAAMGLLNRICNGLEQPLSLLRTRPATAPRE